jgi:hypothetical protein
MKKQKKNHETPSQETYGKGVFLKATKLASLEGVEAFYDVYRFDDGVYAWNGKNLTFLTESR